MNIFIVFRDKNLKFMNKIKKQVELSISQSFVETAWKNKLDPTQFVDKDLVITFGGDGTFLSASHYVSHQLILGVNSDPKRSAGFLTSTNLKNVMKKLKEVVSGKLKIKTYPRASAKIFHKDKCVLTEKALNEVYIGNSRPQHISVYSLKFRNKKELQKSSGIIISTGTGSTAWYKSIGGKPFDKSLKTLKFIVREPLVVKNHRTRIRKGQVSGKEKITLFNRTNHCVLAIDSIREYKLR